MLPQQAMGVKGEMPRLTIVVAAMTAIIVTYRAVHHEGRSHQPDRSCVLYYVDPMHHAYRSSRPGVAPDCGMQLVPVYADDAAESAPTRLSDSAVRIDSAGQRLAAIQVATANRSGHSRTIRVVGRVTPIDRLAYRINSGVDGVIRETYNDSVGVRVEKHQKLATYYSPDFLAVSSGFLAANERIPGAVGNDGARTVPFPGALSKQGVGSVQGYTDRLRNLGMSDGQIRRMAESRQLQETIDIVAPADGTIVARGISPGQHFERNMELYRIADITRVWVLAEVSEEDEAFLHPGEPAQVILSGTGRRYGAQVTSSVPQSEAGGGTVKVRLELENSGLHLRPGMLVDVDLLVRVPAAVTVPLDALVDSGVHSRVYVQYGEDVFAPREVQTGWRTADQVEIRQGVAPGERVVVAATFLVDSESRLRGGSSQIAVDDRRD